MSQIQQGLGKTTVLAEGAETALSVARGKSNWDIYVSFGGARMGGQGVSSCRNTIKTASEFAGRNQKY